jgi:hypothetical protein
MLHGVSVLDVFVQFAATGAIGPLRCEGSLHEIAAVLGGPQDLGRVSKQRRWPHRFGYGDVELSVCRCRRVQSIHVQAWRESIDLPPLKPGVATVRPSGRLTYTQVMAGLQETGCVVEPITSPPPGQLAVRAVRSGVELVFTTDDGAEPLLEKAGSWVAAHDCPPIAEGTPDDGLGLTA